MKEQNQKSETLTISKENYEEYEAYYSLQQKLMIDVWNEISVDELKVGMNIGVFVLWECRNSKVPYIEKGEIVSIDDKFVRVKDSSNSVSAYQIDIFKFVELV